MGFIINPYRFASSAPLEGYWSSSRKSTPAVLSNSDRTLTASGPSATTYANAFSATKIANLGYYSFTVASNTSVYVGAGVGLENRNGVGFPIDSAAFAGDNPNHTAAFVTGGSVYYNFGVVGTIGSGSTSPVEVQVAVRQVVTDPVTGSWRVWIRRGGGAWVGGGDPVANTTPTATLSYNNTTYFPEAYLAASIYQNGTFGPRSVTLAHNAAATTGTPPTGFTAALWSP